MGQRIVPAIVVLIVAITASASGTNAQEGLLDGGFTSTAFETLPSAAQYLGLQVFTRQISEEDEDVVLPEGIAPIVPRDHLVPRYHYTPSYGANPISGTIPTVKMTTSIDLSFPHHELSVSVPSTSHFPGPPPQGDGSPEDLVDYFGSLANSFGFERAKKRELRGAMQAAADAFAEDPTREVFGFELTRRTIEHNESPLRPTEFEWAPLQGKTRSEIVYSVLADQLGAKPAGSQTDLQYFTREMGLGTVDRATAEHMRWLISNPISGHLFADELKGRKDATVAYANYLESSEIEMNEQANQAAHASEQAVAAETAAQRQAAEQARIASAEEQARIARERQERQAEEQQRLAEQARRDQEADEYRALLELAMQKEATAEQQQKLIEYIEDAEDKRDTAIVIPCYDLENCKWDPDVPCLPCNAMSLEFIRSDDFLGNYQFTVPARSDALYVTKYGSAVPVLKVDGALTALGIDSSPVTRSFTEMDLSLFSMVPH